MLATWCKVVSKTTVPIQRSIINMEVSRPLTVGNAGPSCFSWSDCRVYTCVPCEQVNNLLSLVADLKEEFERLCIIRECDRKLDWWNQALLSLKQSEQLRENHDTESSLPSC